MKHYVWANQLKRKSYQKSLRRGRTSHLIHDSAYYTGWRPSGRSSDPVETSLCGLKPDSWEKVYNFWHSVYQNNNRRELTVMETKPDIACGKCIRQYTMMELAE